MMTRPWVVIALVLQGLCCDVFAAEVMEEIVVTATRSQKSVQDNPWSVSVLNRDQLRQSTLDQLADVLADLPGLYVSDAGQPGQKRLRIRGEEARRMALLIDGQEFVDHREVGVPLLVDTASLARVELVRGPASVLYGPKAMGGVINVITTRRHQRPLEAGFNYTYNGATSGNMVSASLGGLVGSTDWHLAYSDVDQANRESPDGEIENTSYQSRGGSAQLSHIVGAHEFGVGFEKFESSSDVYVEPEVRFTPPFLDFRIDIPVRDREKSRLTYSFHGGDGVLEGFKGDYYRQVSDRVFNTEMQMQLGPMVQDIGIYTSSELISRGFNVQSDFAIGDRHKLVTGVQYVADEVDQSRQRVATMGGNVISETFGVDRAELDTAAVYVQDEWSITPGLTLLGGMRSYRVDGRLLVSGNGVMPTGFEDSESIASLALVYELTPTTTLRANLAEGYIYPSLMNLAVGAFAGSRFVNPDPGLLPETSISREVGLRHVNDGLVLDITLFESRASDYIDHVVCVPSDGCLGTRDEIYKNVGEARSFGMETSAAIALEAIEIYTDLTLMKRRKSYEGIDSYNSGIPKISGRVGVRGNLSQRLGFNAFARFEGASKEDVATRSGIVTDLHPGFVTLNVDVDWDVDERFSANFAIANALDKSYVTATENVAAPGRHVRLRLGFKI